MPELSDDVILEGNLAIADFIKYDDVNCARCRYDYSCNHLQCGLTKSEKDNLLDFHLSFSSLVQAIELINGFGQGTYVSIKYENGKAECNIEVKVNNGVDFFVSIENDSLIDVTWLAVVEFIKWYNGNKEV